jgi:glycosyltransferase involved in cell wall biosynthesis
VTIPDEVGEPDEPPHVLFVGRLSLEKGILEFLEATEGLPRVIVGDGPLRDLVPEAVGFVPPSEVGAYYERAAVVCVPSRREGLGFAAHEAMAWGRPIVASAVGGLIGAFAILVEPGDVPALRGAIELLLADPERRNELGAGARKAAEARLSHSAATALAGVYEEARG